MNKLYKGYDDITASEPFKQRIVCTLQSEAKTEPVKLASGLRIGKRTWIAVIAAAVLTLAMGTAAAVGISTAGRLKENTEERLETTEEVRYRAAREKAEQIVDSASYAKRIPLDASQTAQDVTIRCTEIECDGDELLLTLTATGERTGMVLEFGNGFPTEDVHTQRILETYDSFCEIGIDAQKFRLQFNGSDYAPYYSEDLPSALGYGNGDDLVIRFFGMPKIENGTEMTLCGTLYRCDRTGARQGEIGTFSIPFVYAYTDEMREADIEREAQQILMTERTRDETQQFNLENLPEEAVTLEQNVGFTVFHDVSADEQGILLGLTNTVGVDGDGTARFQSFYMNGYRVTAEELAYEWDEAFHTNTLVMRLPYYAQQPYLDPVLTVACVDISGQETKTNDGWLPPQTYDVDTFVFRYDLRTGKVTLPESDAERDAWFTPKPLQSYERAYDFIRPGYRVIEAETEKQEQNGVPVCIRRAAFCDDGTMEIFYQAENLSCEVMAWETFPEEVLLNGEPAPRYVLRAWDYEWQPFRLTDDRIAEFLDTYRMDKTRWIIDSWKVVPAKRFDMYDGPITIEIRNWKLYDLNERGEREYVGTYNFTFTVDPADAYTQPVNAREGLRKR